MRAFTHIDVPQRSPEWHAARLGRLTGSCAGDMLATIKSGEAAARRNLRARLVVERLTGEPQEDGWQSDAMRRGVEREPNAIAAYEALTGELLQITGFLSHVTEMAGCSLDGHVGDVAGIVEIKCPMSATHLRYLRDARIPSDYLPQIFHNLWITGAAWCDFVSFDDRMPENLRLVVRRYERKDAEIDQYADQARAFLREVDTELAALKTMSDVGGQLKAAIA